MLHYITLHFLMQEVVLAAVYSPYWSEVLAEKRGLSENGFADINDNEVTSSGTFITVGNV